MSADMDGPDTKPHPTQNPASFPWSRLGITPTDDKKTIRSAYAACIKAMDLDGDVEGYAQLRSARDTALRLAQDIAREKAEQETGPPNDGTNASDLTDENDTVKHAANTTSLIPIAHPSVPWLFAAPQWDENGDRGEPALTTHGPSHDPIHELIPRVSPDFTPTGDPAHSRLVAASTAQASDPFTKTDLQGYADQGSSAEVTCPEVLHFPFARLATLLNPEGPDGVDPMDAEQEAQAHALLKALLDTVFANTVSQQTEMENWLATVLANAWPRSAPLVEQTAQAFSWDHEWDKFDARRSIEFLGSRLRGYRFQRDVQDKNHRFHRAWAELTKAGKAGPFRILRTNSTDVRALLLGIRKNHPELENQFDPQRVASWETDSGNWSTIALAIIGLALLAVVIALGDRPSIAQQDRTKVNAAMITEAFGPPHDADWLNRHQPDLAIIFSNNAKFGEDGTLNIKSSVDAGLSIVRQLAFFNGRNLAGDQFENIMQLRLSLLKTAQASGTEACQQTLKTGAPPPQISIHPDVRIAERNFASAMVEKGLMSEPKTTPPITVKIPGSVISLIIKDTGLTREQVSQALLTTGDHAANRCIVTIALMQAVLNGKGDLDADQRRLILQAL